MFGYEPFNRDAVAFIGVGANYDQELIFVQFQSEFVIIGSGGASTQETVDNTPAWGVKFLASPYTVAET